ncbi:fatty-acid--CoA ligase FadD8 [Nocardioides limicola]|uniref:fatty-acid--CoA ligase FadD8 n=1 Tax=Nocardioides limicola TaxID=2803368 RepID=UPI00193C4DFB|nr:fatty-acid--CoA ligase FadD8 [Nocardioides sp. DJM-14]
MDTLRWGTHNGHLMVAALRRHHDDPVISIDTPSGPVTLTGGDVATRISQYVQAFDGLGGTPSALLALNRPEVLYILGAGQTQGFRRTALHPLGSADDHAYVINDAGIDTLIVDPVFAGRAVELLERCDGLKRVLTIGPVPDTLAETGTDLVALAATYPEVPLRARLLAPDHVVSIAYTGGTTGKPKGVIGTAETMNTMTQVQLAEWEWPTQPKFLMCTPLSHAGAAFFVPVVVQGGSLVVLSKFDPAEVLRTIEEQRITATMLVPSMLYALLDHPDSHTRDLSSLETVYYGAAPINPTRLAEAIERFGPIFAQYYGQSEAPMVISYLGRADHDLAHPERLSSCGRPSAFLRTALLDADGNEVPAGEPGEICVAGPLLAGGYWNLPEATAETFRDGWLRTGDVAREDADGYWYIVDRTKDMIVTGGFNVFPREVEDVIGTHPAVAQVAVIGTPDERWGEAVTALVVLREGHEYDDALAAEIADLVKEKKGSVQAPKQVLPVDSIPLTALGKPDKKALRAQFWGDRTRSVG